MTWRGARTAAVLLLLAAAGITEARAAAPTPGAERPATLPSWEGVWVAENLEAEVSGVLSVGPLDGEKVQRLYPLAGFSAPWNEAGWAKFERMLATSVTSAKAIGFGYPMMMDAPAPLQFYITPAGTLIANIYRELRYVPTDGRPHVSEEDRWPTTWGSSIGRWEGDTLVIDTVSVKHPPDHYQFAPPLSERAHYVERLRMTAPDRIESEITIEDPVTLTGPWKVRMAYRRALGMDRIVYEPADNDRTGDDGDSFTIEPAKPRPQPQRMPNRIEAKLPAAEIDRVIGRYELAPNLILTVRRQGDVLLAGAPILPTLPIHAEAPLNFFQLLLDVRMRFTTDAAGRVAGVIVTAPGAPAITGKRLPAP